MNVKIYKLVGNHESDHQTVVPKSTDYREYHRLKYSIIYS